MLGEKARGKKKTDFMHVNCCHKTKLSKFQQLLFTKRNYWFTSMCSMFKDSYNSGVLSITIYEHQ